MNTPHKTHLTAKHWLGLLGLLLVLRLLSLGAMPLTDHTEARYAEIARLMVVQGDWISPHITPDEVFWAKPPLSTWTQAAAMAALGVSEWAARLPAVAWSLLSLWALAWMLRVSLSALQVSVALVALVLSPLFFISAGAVMTDATLGACVMLVQAAWWRVLQSEGAARTKYARVLALGMALALLTKGPAAAVLALLPILLHAGWRRHWPVVLSVLRDPSVWLICLGLSLPWYVVAEIKTPGFLQYFVLGEHVMRFLQPGWTGDRYGFAHAQPRGIIWAFTVVAALPAVVVMLLRLAGLRWGQGRGAVQRQLVASGGTELASYAVCIVLAPLLLFSFARNLIFTYAMTALPGLAILAVQVFSERTFEHIKAGAIAGVLGLVFAWAFLIKLPEIGRQHSDLPLIQAYEAACPAQDCRLSYVRKPPYSAYFYTAGRLYAGMPGQPGAPAFVVQPFAKNSSPPIAALACNKEQCLLRDESAATNSR
ncbi:ArnT family glycosyltransferase [Roseateles koreensis]|uniref:Phospholipid carrier-dependent glycosyltransferase n=1 Tax=Roseateles koreensis TaxID=2987526 RepID=A0ABT5KQD6_9BURK|nr:phospholipid carrier-dependent glycosyltransferase [Roseateles koreensis]MDC8785104.1 phospholipid carrier-dependent glycosyltransferase [Roseateles koreensis]